MNNAESNRRDTDPEQYANEVHSRIKGLYILDQIRLALICAIRVARFHVEFAPKDQALELALKSVDQWLSGGVPTKPFAESLNEVLLAFESATDAYESTDQLNDIWNASTDGIKAYKATESARSVMNLLHAAMASTEHHPDVPTSEYCADAMADALAAELFSSAEIEFQNEIISNIGNES